MQNLLESVAVLLKCINLMAVVLFTGNVANGGEKVNRPNTDIILISKTGKPVRREGPNWKPDRLDGETLFILGSKANKALGYGQTRGRLYIKHPELFK